MKKLSKLILALLASTLLISCYNDNTAAILAALENTPDTPINRNVALSNVTEQSIVKGQNYDFSAQTGKKAFLVVMNKNTEGPKTVFTPSSTNNSFINDYDYMFENENGMFYNVPFNPDYYENNPIETNLPSFNSNIMFDDNNTTESIPTNEGSHWNFHAATSDNLTNDEWAHDAVLKVIGTHCYVWYKEKTGINITQPKLQAMADAFDSIYEKETSIFGSNNPSSGYNTSTYISMNDQPTSQDNNPMVHIIVYDLFDDYETTKETKAGTLGYFWALDFYNQDQNWNGGICKTNKCECLHMDSYFLEIAAEHQRSTIAHEFQHLLHFVNKKLNNNQDSPQWFNEMMSMVCEDIMQTQLGLNDSASPKGRLSTFNNAYEKGFIRWRTGNNVYNSYANAYAFGAYLVRNYGIDFIKKLALNSETATAAIEAALVEKNCPEQTFDAAYEKFYNVILNPKGTDYTLNKTVSETYGSNTFTCTAINLFDYITVSGNYVKGNTLNNLYQASKLNDYYGPYILNNKIYNSLDESGLFVSYLGIVGTDSDDKLNPIFALNNNASSDTDVIYKMVFAN